jgi:hypothetical protein
MQSEIRVLGRRLLLTLAIAIGVALLHAVAIGPPAAAGSAAAGSAGASDPAPSPDAVREAFTFSDVVFYDGSAWQDVKLTTGSVEGPAGGASATARIKSGLGGPKTYFLLGGDASALRVPVPRPRFRLAADEGTVRRLQLAQFEVKDGVRRTTVEIGKVTTFKKGSELEVTKVSNGLWEVKPKKSLQPGEYALVLSESGPVADFNVGEGGY